MDQSRPADEQGELRKFLERLESSKLVIRRSGVDVSQYEISILKNGHSVVDLGDELICVGDDHRA
jgi:hypothetical protein